MHTLFKTGNNMWVSSYKNDIVYITRKKEDALRVDTDGVVYDILVKKDYIPVLVNKTYLFKDKNTNRWISNTSDIRSSTLLFTSHIDYALEVHENSNIFYFLSNKGYIGCPVNLKKQDRSILFFEV